ncbi:hypothetical protein PJI17_31940, partial [Mycobacterium kansasii]
NTSIDCRTVTLQLSPGTNLLILQFSLVTALQEFIASESGNFSSDPVSADSTFSACQFFGGLYDVIRVRNSRHPVHSLFLESRYIKEAST